MRRGVGAPISPSDPLAPHPTPGRGRARATLAGVPGIRAEVSGRSVREPVAPEVRRRRLRASRFVHRSGRASSPTPASASPTPASASRTPASDGPGVPPLPALRGGRREARRERLQSRRVSVPAARRSGVLRESRRAASRAEQRRREVRPASRHRACPTSQGCLLRAQPGGRAVRARLDHLRECQSKEHAAGTLQPPSFVRCPARKRWPGRRRSTPPQVRRGGSEEPPPASCVLASTRTGKCTRRPGALRLALRRSRNAG
jgi:hypothetical protein